MTWSALTCPQCSAPLPRVALWRAVKCGSCGALITRDESIVTRDSFRQAWKRAQDQSGSGVGHAIGCGGHSYQLEQSLGTGDLSKVFLARRLGPMPLLATIKLSTSSDAATHYRQEAQALRDLHEGQTGAASAYASQRLPIVLWQGAVGGTGGQQALIFRYHPGCWGSLAAVSQRYPQGLDPRHLVWIWRRLLDVLHFVHSQGWSHGDIRPEHALVLPKDHGVRLIGWGTAKANAPVTAQVEDLKRSARVIQVLTGMRQVQPVALSQTVPNLLLELVNRASEDEAFCRAQGAYGLDQLLRATAREVFGPPSFVPLIL